MYAGSGFEDSDTESLYQESDNRDEDEKYSQEDPWEKDDAELYE